MNFGLAKNGNLWTITSDGRETHFEMPIYQEIVFVDMDGREQIKVSNECTEYPFTCSMVEDGQLKDVSKPANTLYKSETYFSESAKLKSGEVYIGTPMDSALLLRRRMPAHSLAMDSVIAACCA